MGILQEMTSIDSQIKETERVARMMSDSLSPKSETVERVFTAFRETSPLRPGKVPSLPVLPPVEIRLTAKKTFLVNSSRIDELRGKPKDFNSSLIRTRACYNVERGADGKFGVCTKPKCDFAHSLDELQDRMCTFDSKCRRRFGTKLRDGSFDESNICQYRHSDESREQYYERTGEPLPDLPVQRSVAQVQKESEDKVAPLEHPRKVQPRPTLTTFIPPPASAPASIFSRPPLTVSRQAPWAPKKAPVSRPPSPELPIPRDLLDEFDHDRRSETDNDTVIIQVPARYFDSAMGIALNRGLKKFRIVVRE